MFVSPSAMPSLVERLRCVTRESCSTASRSLRSRCASMSMSGLLTCGSRGLPIKIVPGDQLVFREGPFGDASDDLAELPRRDAGAGPLGPDVVGADDRADRDRANRHDAVVRHVADVLLTRLNLLRRAAG